MDPNATLREIRSLTRPDEPLAEHESERLQELFHALDKWIMLGGFLPADWSLAVTS